MAESQKKIQGLGSDLGQMYQGLEQGLSSLPSQAQQASTNFFTSTTGRISGLGSQIGSSVGQGFSDLGSGIRGSADDLTALLERQREEEDERRRAQEDLQRQDARRRRDQLVQGVGERYEGFQEGLQNVRQARAPELLRGARSGLDWIDERTPELPEGQRPGSRSSTLGGTPSQRARAIRTGTGTLRTTLSSLEEGMSRVRGSRAAQEQALARGEPLGALGETAGLLGTAALGAAEAAGAPFRALGGAYGGGTLPGGSDRSLLGIPEDTPVLGGLTNPVEMTRLGGEALAPGLVVDDVLRALGAGFRAGRPVVERFVREVGEGPVRRVLQEGAESLGALFDGYLARAAEAVPGGREGPMGRLLLDETGAAGAPRLPGGAPGGAVRRREGPDFVVSSEDGKAFVRGEYDPQTGELLIGSAWTDPEVRGQGRYSGLMGELARWVRSEHPEATTVASVVSDETGTVRRFRDRFPSTRYEPGEEVVTDIGEVAYGTGPLGAARRLLGEEAGMAGRRTRRRGGRLAATPGPDRGPTGAAGEPIPELLAREPEALTVPPATPTTGTVLPGETPLPGQRPSAGVPRSRTGVPEGPREGTARDDFRRKVQMFSGEAQLPQAARDPTAGRESVLATVRNPTRRLLSGIREQLFDEYARVGDVQRRVYGDRPLSDAEDVVGRIRKFGGRAPTVEAYRRENLDPVLEQVGQDGDRLDAYVSSYDDYDKARSAGRTAAQGVLDRDLGRLPGETALRRQSRVVSAGQRAVDEAELALRRAEKSGQADQIAAADTRLRQAERLLADQQRRTEDLLSGPDVSDVGLRSSAKAVQRRSEGVREASEALDRAKLQGDEDAVAFAEEGLRKARVRERNARRKLDRLQGVVDTAATQRTRGQLQQALLRGEEVQTNRVFSGDTRAHPPVQIESALSDEVGGDLGRIQRVHEGADALFEAARHARDRLHEAEIIDDQMHRYLEEHFPHYVPTVFVDKLEQGAENVLTTGAARFSVKDLREASGVPMGRRLSERGSEGARESPITSINRLLYASETLAQRNEVARAFERMIEYDAKHGGGELAQAFVRMPDPDAQLPTTHTKFSVRGLDAQGKAEVRTYAVRKDVGSMLALDPDTFRQVAGAIGEVTGAPLARAVQTGFSPIFMLKNAVIDAQQAMQRRGGFNLGRPKEAGDAWRALFGAGRDLGALNPVAAVRGREVLDTPDYAEFIRAGGGQTSGRFGRSPGEERARALGIAGFDNRKREYLRRRMLANGQPDPGDKLLGVLDHGEALKWFDTLRAAIDSVEEVPGVGGVVGGVRRFGEAIEATPRLAAYRQARAAGKRPLEQMRAGSEVTIDFRRGGKAVRSLNAVLPFLNAAVQGSERFVTQDLAKGNRANTAWALGAIGLPTLAIEAYNRTFEEDYADVPQYLKDTGIVVMDPFSRPEIGTDAEGNPSPGSRGYLYIPLNRPMAQMKAALNESIDMATGNRPADFKELAVDVLGAAAPVDLGAGGFLPPAPRLAAELLTNKDLFRDREIVPEYVQHRPPGEQATDRTGATARLVGETIGKPPAVVEHLGAGVTGGPGRLLGPLADRAVELARPDLAPPDQRDRRGLGGVPVLGDLSEAFYRSSGGQQERDLRRRLEHEAAQQKASIRREYVTSPGWSELPAGERQALLDDLYKEIDAEALERLRAEREVLLARRLERQGA